VKPLSHSDKMRRGKQSVIKYYGHFNRKEFEFDILLFLLSYRENIPVYNIIIYIRTIEFSNRLQLDMETWFIISLSFTLSRPAVSYWRSVLFQTWFIVDYYLLLNELRRCCSFELDFMAGFYCENLLRIY
jgi:hypothetical protein